MSVFEESKVYKPFKYEWAVDITKEHDNHHWTEDEAALANDLQQWVDGSLRSQKKEFIRHTLKMFTQSDVAVGQTYKKKLLPVVKNNEVSNMLASFAAREGIHQRAYALLNETLGFDDDSWSAFLEEESMKAKWDLMTADEDNTSLQVAKLILNEGVSLFASFVMLLTFGLDGEMLGMCEITEWSIRDENMHVKGNSMLYKELQRLTDGQAHTLAAEILEKEMAFIDKAYEFYVPENLPKDDLKEYMRYITDMRLVQMGHSKLFYAQLPSSLNWVDAVISGKSDKNFFEGKVTDYTVVNMTGELDWNKIIPDNEDGSQELNNV